MNTKPSSRRARQPTPQAQRPRRPVTPRVHGDHQGAPGLRGSLWGRSGWEVGSGFRVGPILSAAANLQCMFP